ncbi:MAG: hypothetical protein AMS24_02545 [Chlamydiae bacterium SM23_39]|nr:MAG: hypothetical protein AMS24_02545 [Chlamydiae bacterium SM23_39]
MKRIFILFFLFLGCYKDSLYVQIENIRKDFLASHHVGTPDHRKKHPPIGQRVIVSFDFSSSLLKKEPFICLTVRFWDNREIVKKREIKRRWGTEVFYFPNKEKNKILTYLVQIIDKEGKIIKKWEHQFWTDLIDIDKED